MSRRHLSDHDDEFDDVGAAASAREEASPRPRSLGTPTLAAVESLGTAHAGSVTCELCPSGALRLRRPATCPQPPHSRGAQHDQARTPRAGTDDVRVRFQATRQVALSSEATRREI